VHRTTVCSRPGLTQPCGLTGSVVEETRTDPSERSRKHRGLGGAAKTRTRLEPCGIHGNS
jgi:hypothetical protein